MGGPGRGYHVSTGSGKRHIVVQGCVCGCVCMCVYRKFHIMGASVVSSEAKRAASASTSNQS